VAGVGVRLRPNVGAGEAAKVEGTGESKEISTCGVARRVDLVTRAHSTSFGDVNSVPLLDPRRATDSSSSLISSSVKSNTEKPEDLRERESDGPPLGPLLSERETT
jgi:hypothetical protein